MDLMYYYVKFPFLLIFTAVLLEGLGRRPVRARLTVGTLAAASVLAFSLVLSFLVFWKG